MRGLPLLLATAFALCACNTELRPGNRLPILTGPHLAGTCPANDPLTVQLERDGDGLAFIDIETEDPVTVVWPVGFAAWDVNGQAILYASDGMEVLKEGGPDVPVRGKLVATDSLSLFVCEAGGRPYN